MKSIFKRTLAGFVSVALVATLLIGVSANKTVKAADEVTLTPWSFYEGAASFRNGDDPWAARFYNSVTTTAGESLTEWGSSAAATEEMTQTTTKVADGFTADILTTGWDGDYTVTPVGDNPYMLRAEMMDIPVIEGHDYTITFNVQWTNGDGAPEKNIQVGIANPYESVFASNPDAVTHIVVQSGSTATYTQNFTVWAGSDIDIMLAYGAFLKRANDGLTTENTNASGVLKVTGLTITDNGQNPDYVAPPEPASTTPAPTTVAPTTPAPAVKKLAQVKKVKVKDLGAGKVKITWKKVTNAKKYKVKVGKATYKVKKAKLIVKKLVSGKTYKIKVRALKANGYKAGAWSKAKKITVK